MKLHIVNPLSKIAQREIIGIDIGHHNLTLCYIRSALNKTEVVTLACKEITNLSNDDIAKVIKELCFAYKLKSPSVGIMVPSYSAITKNIEIPSRDPQEIREIISLQAGRHTPYAREEILVDYLEIGTYKNSYTRILLVIVVRTIIKRYTEIINKAGLKLDRVFFAPEGLSWAAHKLLKLESDLPISLVNVDALHTDFMVISKHKPLFLRSISIGVLALTAEAKEEQRLKFVEELKKSFEAYQSEAIEKSPHTIFLTGATEEIIDMEVMIRQGLNVPVKTIPYLRNIPFSGNFLRLDAKIKQVSFLSLIACLFAWNDLKIDLTPEEIKLRKSLEERGRDLTKTGVLILSSFVLIFLILVTNMCVKSATLKNLKNRYRDVEKEAQALDRKYERVSLIRNYLLNRGYPLEVLTELYTLIPLELKLSYIRLDEQGKFSIKGTAGSMSMVLAFVSSMEKSKYFKNVETRNTSKRKEGDKDVADFEIAAAVEKE